MATIELRPFSQNDFKELVSWVRTPEELFIWSATTFTFPLDENQLDKHFQDAQSAKLRLMYTAMDSLTKEHVGHIELTRIDRENRKASIACVLIDPAKRGRGYAAAMLQSILEECFHQMKMSKVDLFVFPFNQVAIHCYQKAGFEIEEVVDDRVELKRQFCNTLPDGIELRKMDCLQITLRQDLNYN